MVLYDIVGCCQSCCLKTLLEAKETVIILFFFLFRSKYDVVDASGNSSDRIFLYEIPNIELKNAFRLDRSPDGNNLIYGSIYKTQIAKYNLDHGKNQSKKNKQTNDTSRYFCLRGRMKDWEETNKITVKSSSWEGLPQFIPLELKFDQNNIGQSLESNHNISSQNDVENEIENLNRQLTENPQDVNLWIKLMSCQDGAFYERKKQILDVSTERMKQDAKILAEIKSSIVEKGLEKNPTSILLQMARLQQGEMLWDAEQIGKEWKNLVFGHCNDPLVWKHYLKYLMGSLKLFSVPRTMAAYRKCLTTLNSIHSKAMTSHVEMPNTIENMIG